jgi:neutral trehalase
MLSDLESNGRYLSRDDYMIIRKARRNLSALTEDEAKRLRHLLYKNTNRLQGSYSRGEIRAMLKKASRTASMKELSDLRAHFEQNVNMLYSIVSELEANPVAEQHFSSEMGELLGSMARLSNHGQGLGNDLESAITKIEIYQQEISDAFDVVRMINNRAKKLPDFF